MDKRAQIIEAGTRLFAERGFENTPLSLICDTLQVSKGLIFHHFKSKNELLRQIFSQTTELIVGMNEPDREFEGPRERLLHLLESFFDQLESDKLFFQFNLNIMLQPGTRTILQDLIQERSSFILNSVKTIFAELDPENDELRAYLFVAELDGIALNYLCIFENYPLEAIRNQVLRKYTQDEFLQN